jgi:redox-sensitive bicupin YhaK (pirin superfamily)
MEPARLVQIWIMPRKQGGAPRWEQKQFMPSERAGKLLPVVSSKDAQVDGTLTIDQDATVYVSSLKQGESVEHETKPGRLTYLFVITGQVEAEAGAVTLSTGDQLRIADPMDLKLTATEPTELILIDMPTAQEES